MSTKRTVKWCPELAILTFRSWDGRERMYTEQEVKEFVMSDDTRKVFDELLQMAKDNPNQRIEY